VRRQLSNVSALPRKSAGGKRDIRKSALVNGAEGYALRADVEREPVPAIAGTSHDRPLASSV
jgi:hypothetical protein